MFWKLRFKLSAFFLNLGAEVCPEPGCRLIIKAHIRMAAKCIIDTLEETK
jgi:hypothetical protein